MVSEAVDPLVNVPHPRAGTTIEVPALGVVLPYIGIACWQYITNRYGCSCTLTCIVTAKVIRYCPH
jgi:hypothetical protein